MLAMRSREPSLHSVITTFLRRAPGMLHRLAPRLVVIGDLLEAFACGILAQWLDRNRRAVEIVEQRVHLFLEQRQPVFHAGIAAALGDGLIEVVVPRRRAERR